MGLNIAAVVGRLVAEPELKTTKHGTSVMAFTVAVKRSYSKENDTDFLDVVAWGKTAEFIKMHFVKGNLIAVDGRIQSRLYEDKEGKTRKATEIIANNINFVDTKKKEPDYEARDSENGLPF